MDNQHNRIVAVCLDILKEIDRLCTAHGLRYFGYAGTLLGAVRHRGVIPWDDDIDIVMPRKDYEEFARICKSELDERFALQSIETDKLTNNAWMKMHARGTAFISGQRRKGCMEGINIDIFPIDNVPDSSFVRRLRAKRIDFTNYIYEFRFGAKRKDDSLKLRFFKSLIKLLPPFGEQRFKRRYEKYLQKYNNKITRDVVYFSNRKYLRKVIDRHVFDRTVYLPFENTQIPAPKEWEKVLVGLYGENYMELPPESERVSVHGSELIDLEHDWTEHGEAYAYEKI